MRRWTVRTRLQLGFGALLVMLVVVSAIAVTRLSALRESVRYMTREVVVKSATANDLTDAVNEAARYKLASFSVTDAASIAKYGEEVSASRERINAAYARLDSLAGDTVHADTAMQRQVTHVKALRKVHAAAFDSAQALRRAGQLAASEQLLTASVMPTLREYVAAIDTMVSVFDASLAQESDRANVQVRQSVLWIAVVSVLVVIAGLIVGFLTYRSITVPLADLTTVANRLADGDCNVTLDAGDARDEVAVLSAAMQRMAEAEASVAHAAHRLSAGDVNVDIRVRGEHDTLGAAMQHVRATLVDLQVETSRLSRAAEEGRLDERADVARFDGAFRTLLVGLNETVDHLLAPIHEARTALEGLASRDLSQRMRTTWSGDHADLASALNTAADALDRTLGEVLLSSEQVNGAALQIADGGQQLARSSAQQAASLEEVASGLQELGALTRTNSAHAVEARGLAEDARASSARGIEEMLRLTASITRIKEASDSTARIVKSIDEIAFQTNLLALNAAVEAARAGDAGRGFAVVAEEVRALAIRSAEAARQTTTLIEQAVTTATEGVELNQAVRAQLDEITQRVDRVSTVMIDVANGSAQQHDGIQAIGQAIDQLNGITQAVAASSEESASASEELAGQATSLTTLVGAFVLTDSGSSSAMRDVRRGAQTRGRRAA